MYFPSLSEIQALRAAQPAANLAPFYRDVAAALETPVSAFLKVARGDHSFLLESVEGGERLARYSFIGTAPYPALPRGADPQAFPEALFMFTDTILVFDHLKHTIKVVAHCRLDGDLEASYRQACWRIDELVERLPPPPPPSSPRPPARPP